MQKHPKVSDNFAYVSHLYPSNLNKGLLSISQMIEYQLEFVNLLKNQY